MLALAAAAPATAGRQLAGAGPAVARPTGQGELAQVPLLHSRSLPYATTLRSHLTALDKLRHTPSPTRLLLPAPPTDRAPPPTPSKPGNMDAAPLDSLLGSCEMSIALPSQLLVLDAAASGAALLAAHDRPVVSLPCDGDIFSQPPTPQWPLPGSQARASGGAAPTPTGPLAVLLAASPFAVGSACAQAAPGPLAPAAASPGCSPPMAAGPFASAAATSPVGPSAAAAASPTAGMPAVAFAPAAQLAAQQHGRQPTAAMHSRSASPGPAAMAAASSGSSGDAGWEEAPAVDQASSSGSEREGWAAAQVARQRRATANAAPAEQCGRQELQARRWLPAWAAVRCVHACVLLSFKLQNACAAPPDPSVRLAATFAGSGGAAAAGQPADGRRASVGRSRGQRGGRVLVKQAPAVASGAAWGPAASTMHLCLILLC